MTPKADQTRNSISHLAQSAMAGANVGIVIADGGLPDTPLVYVNAEFERITGYSFEELVGRNCRLLQGADTDPEDVARMRVAIADQVPIDLTLRNYRKDGSPFWNHVRILPVYEPGRSEPYYVGYSRVLDLPLSGDTESESALRVPRHEGPNPHPGSFLGFADLDGLITAVSAGTEPTEQWVGVHLWDLPWWQGAPQVRTFLEETVQRARSGHSTHRDVETLGEEGTSRWSELRVEPRVDSEGDPQDLLLSMLDVTDRVMAERFRYQLAEVVENSPDGIVYLDTGQRVTFANKAALRLFEAAANDDLVGRGLDDLLEGTDPPLDPPVLEAITEGEAWEGLGLATGPAGRRTPVSIAILKHHGDSARDAYSLVLRDRTDAERRQQRLMAELRTARILDGATSLREAMPGVLEALVETLGADSGAYLIPSPDAGWQRSLHHGEDDTADSSPGSTSLPETRTRALAAEAWERREPVWSHEGKSARGGDEGPDAPSRDQHSVALPIAGEDGPLGTLVLDFRGLITGRTEWNEGLSNVARSIRDFHRWEQTEAELRAARLAADAASKAKSRFLGSMSHELRTPMAAILGYAELLMARVDPESRAMLEVVLRNGNHMVDMLNDILDLTRVEQGHIELVRERFSPVAMAYDLASLMQVRAGSKDLRFETRYEGDLPREIETDHTRLRQILINLIGNAIRFTAEGEVCLTLRGDLDRPDPQLAFEVTDTGIGIAPEHLTTIFEPFDQGDPTTGRRYGGTGLGLAISKRLAEALGAELLAESEPGVGSTFTVTMPVGIEAAAERLTTEDLDRMTSHPDPGSYVPTIELQGRYLVVDDHEDMRGLVSYYLNQSGATVDEAVDGSEAVALVESGLASGQTYQAIVMDMQMPVMDGYQATRIICARSPMTPVIALSAGAMKGDREKALDAGCSAFLAKPVNGSRLLAMIADLTAAQEESNGEGASLDAATLKLLLVEDDRDLGDVTSRILEQGGAEVRISTTGSEAIEVATSWKPDLILLDMNLPDMSGLEVHEALSPRLHEDTRFVAMSGESSSKEECLTAGFTDFHLKPLSLDLLKTLGRDSAGGSGQ